MIEWKATGQAVQRKREACKLTQDMLAAKIGVRLATIARIESGHSRPSFSMLEKLATFFNCRVVDLLQEREDPKMRNEVLQNEPALLGAPSFFRCLIQEAAQRQSTIGHHVMDYSSPGYELGRHAEAYLEEKPEAWQELISIWKPRRNVSIIETETLAFFQREFPGCLALVPRRRIQTFMRGLMAALENEQAL